MCGRARVTQPGLRAVRLPFGESVLLRRCCTVTAAHTLQMVWEAAMGSWEEAACCTILAGGVLGLALLIRARRNRQRRAQ